MCVYVHVSSPPGRGARWIWGADEFETRPPALHHDSYCLSHLLPFVVPSFALCCPGPDPCSASSRTSLMWWTKKLRAIKEGKDPAKSMQSLCQDCREWTLGSWTAALRTAGLEHRLKRCCFLEKLKKEHPEDHWPTYVPGQPVAQSD
nr:guanine nucleotide-binding protein G(I)/G(S)/G(O) subunit gamma-7 isoform X1 [Vicugna pacos]